MMDRLDAEYVQFLIHIDKKSSIEEFKRECIGDNVLFIEDRVNCIWGDFSQVQATLNLVYALEEFNVLPKDRVVLKSGQDYPIRSVNEIRQFYLNNQDVEFIETFNAKDKEPRAYRNFRGYKVNVSDKRGDYVLFKKNSITGAYKSLLKGCFKFRYLKYFFNEKELDSHTVFYKGSQWWALSYSTLQKIVTYYKENYNELYTFFNVSFCTDEYFFQTLLYKVKDSDASIKIQNTVTYVSWDRVGVSLPVTFHSEDLGELKEKAYGDYLYARKFETDQDEVILDLIDKQLLEDN